MTTHALRLDLFDGTGLLGLDGHDISHGVRSINLQVSPRQTPRVILELVVHTAHVNATEADVTIPDTTAQLLVKLGWTPPAADTE